MGTCSWPCIVLKVKDFLWERPGEAQPSSSGLREREGGPAAPSLPHLGLSLRWPVRASRAPQQVATGLFRSPSWNPFAPFCLLPWPLLTLGLGPRSDDPSSLQMWCFEPIQASGAWEPGSSVNPTQCSVLAPRSPASLLCTLKVTNLHFTPIGHLSKRPRLDRYICSFLQKIIGGKLTKCYKLICYSHNQIFCCYFLLGKYIYTSNFLYSVFNCHGVSVATLQAFHADPSRF